MLTDTPKSWEEVKDLVASSESFDDDFGSAYDRVAYDVPNKGNAAGIKLPKRASEMTIGELEDFYGTAKTPTEARKLSQAYGAQKFGPESPQAKYGSSGTGKYQFEVTTLSQTAKELYGDNYRNVVYSPDEQEKLAKHLYDTKAKLGPAALATTWTSLGKPSKTTAPVVVAAAATPEKDSSVVAPLLAAGALGTVSSLLPGSRAQRVDDGRVDSIGTLSQWLQPRLRTIKPRVGAVLRRKTERTKMPVGFKAFRRNVQEQIIRDSEDYE